MQELEQLRALADPDASDAFDGLASTLQALHAAPLSQAGFDYEKYLYWFMAQNLLEPAKPEFPDLVWQRIKAAQAAALA